MKRRKHILLFGLVAVLLGSLSLVVAFSRRPADPVYEGQPLSKWVADYSSRSATLGSKMWDRRAIREIGTNGLPLLLKMLKRRDSVIETKLKYWINQQSFLHTHLTFAYEYRYGALGALRVLGPTAKPASPAVVELLRDDYWLVSQVATNAIKSIDPEAAARAGIKLTNANKYY